jgi:hypothetical protein
VTTSQIPAELRALDQWVTWKREEREGKATKVPYTVDGRRRASCDNPSTWGSFAKAARSLAEARVSGTGFQVAEGQDTVGADFDHCRTAATGAIAAWAQEIIDELDSYTEISPSQEGIRIFVHGVKPGPRCRTGMPDGGAFEFYDRSRFLTVTGQHLEGTPLTVEHRQEALDRVYERLFPEKPGANGHTAPADSGLTAWEVIALASKARNGAKFQALMRGDTSGHGGDDSAADLALCSIVAFYARDPGVIDQVVRQSGLYREKWDRPDYRDRTIERALERATEAYSPPGPAPTQRIEQGRAPRSSEADAALIAIPDFPVDTLPDPVRRFVQGERAQKVPEAYTAGAALAALAVAVGPHSQIERPAVGWVQRAILWPVIIGPPGSAKSPALAAAFRPLTDHDATNWDQAAVDASHTARERPKDRSLIMGDTTLEALGDRLAGGDGSAGVVRDELAQLLSFGEYKRGAGGGDRARYLELWSGNPYKASRITRAPILVQTPTVIISGCLVPASLDLLGGHDDGMRPRWLPHLATFADAGPPAPHDAEAWARLLRHLLQARSERRTWSLGPLAERAFAEARDRWAVEARSEPASVSAALHKADVHLLRLALVLAEVDGPGKGGNVPPEVIERAVAWVDFTLNCWRALPDRDILAISPRDRVLDEGVDKLRVYLEEHGGTITRRELQRRRVAGVRTSAQTDALLMQYEATYPGTVETSTAYQGHASTTIKAPYRRPPSVTNNVVTDGPEVVTHSCVTTSTVCCDGVSSRESEIESDETDAHVSPNPVPGQGGSEVEPCHHREEMVTHGGDTSDEEPDYLPIEALMDGAPVGEPTIAATAKRLWPGASTFELRTSTKDEGLLSGSIRPPGAPKELRV